MKHKNLKLNRIIHNNNGLSLLEVLVSMLLISIISMTFLNMFMYAFNNTILAHNITNKTYAAQAAIENTRSLDYRQLQAMSTTREAFDSNGDNMDDCFVEISYEPYGIQMRPATGPGSTATTTDAIFIHLIYYGSDLMVIAPNGESMFYEDTSALPGYTLTVDSSTTDCKIEIGSEIINFNRDSITTQVIVIVNLEMKEASFLNSFYVKDHIGNATSDAHIQVLGNQTICATVPFPSTAPDDTMLGVINMSTSLVRINVDVFEDDIATKPEISMYEIIEVNNGMPDTQIE